jgi:NADPH-dependent glutamate synthase beta subunit-like oxidoreductase
MGGKGVAMEKGFTLDQALAEAGRCLLCHDAPCSKGCPAGTEPDRFIRKLRFKNLKGAAALIKENNILGGISAAVCPTCTLCAEGCAASGISEPIQIGKIQRFLVEYGWDIGFRPVVRLPQTDFSVAIIGAGPSGLTCAAELAKRGYKATIFERLSRAGGIVRDVIPEYRLSAAFVDREVADVQSLGVEIRLNSPIENQEDLDRLFSDGFHAVYLATGAWECAKLDAAHRDSKDIVDAISFLRLAKQESGAFADLVRGMVVVVLGGGDTAMDAAVTAQTHGAKSVAIVYRRSFNEMPGSQEEKVNAMSEGVDFLFLTQPVDYVIDDGRLKGLKVVRTRLEEPDQTSRKTPVPVNGTEHVIQIDLAVEALGLVPRESIMQLSGLSFDTQRRVIVEEQSTVTSMRQVYAGGDAVRGASIVAHAIADGKNAARQITRALEQAAHAAGPER